MAPGKRWMDWNYSGWGQDNPHIAGYQGPGSAGNWFDGFGLQDISEAQRQGYSGPQIRILAQRAVNNFGRPFGKQAQQEVDRLSPPGSMPWDYGLVGGAEFGQADLNMALGQGADYNKIKEYADYARKHGIGVGVEAENWMRDEKQSIVQQEIAAAEQRRIQDQQTFQADNLRIQREAAAEQVRVQEEMANRAARISGSSPTGVGGPASIKGSRLSITESGGRKGPKRFARPTQYLNTLGIGSGGTTNKSSQVTL